MSGQLVTVSHLDARSLITTQLATLLTELAEGIRDEARDLMFDSPRGGKWYAGQPGPASAPGEAPAVQTGQYTDGIEVQAAGQNEVDILFPSPAAYLELGTAHMAGRPHISRAIQAVRDTIDARVAALGQP